MADGDNSSNMHIISEEDKNADNPHLSPKKRTKDPGVRVKGGRIYDSENGKTCHQCRQKTRDFSASCKRITNEKPCPLAFCHKCLLNRYGEKAEEVGKLEDWMCPRCRGACNCSFCMKRKGCQPTGILSYTAKAVGFNSVEELLHKKGDNVLELRNVVNNSTASPKKSPLSDKGLVALKRKCDKENQSVEQNVLPESNEDGLAKKEKKGTKRMKKCHGSTETQVSVAGAEAIPPKSSEADVSAKCGDNETNQDKEHVDSLKAIPPKSIEANVSAKCGDNATNQDKEHAKAIPPKSSEANVSAKCGDNEINQDKEHADSLKAIPPKSSKANVSAKCGDNEINQDKEHADSLKAIPPKSSEANVSAKGGDNETNQDKENAESMKAKALLKVRKPKKLAVKSHIEYRKEDFVMPVGKPLTEIGGLDLPPQDIGAALQFLEFCNAFSKVLDIKKGQPECILRDLTKGHAKRHKASSALVRFNIKLLSLIDTEMKKDGDAWLQTLKSCIEESHCTLEKLPMEFLDKGLSGYCDLEPSEKIKILSFLCDEVLVTDELRNWIDEAEVKFDEKRKEDKEKIVAARKKEKLIKQKAKDEMAKVLLSARGGTALSLAEFDDLLTQIRSEAVKVQAEVRASLELVHKKHQRSDAVRTDPLMLGINGQILWKLGCYNSHSKIILQDIGNWDSVTPQDKWIIYNEEEEAVIEKYVSSLRNRRFIKHRSDDAEEEKSDPSKVPGSKDCFPQEEMAV